MPLTQRNPLAGQSPSQSLCVLLLLHCWAVLGVCTNLNRGFPWWCLNCSSCAALHAQHCPAGPSTARALCEWSVQINTQSFAKKGNVPFTAPSWPLHQLRSLLVIPLWLRRDFGPGSSFIPQPRRLHIKTFGLGCTSTFCLPFCRQTLALYHVFAFWI